MGQEPREAGMLKQLLLAGAALAVATGAASAKELNSIGITLGTLGNPFFVALSQGAEAQAKKINPNVKVNTASADYDLNKQFTQIDNFIASGVDLILLNAADAKAIAPAVKRAQAAGIVVVGVDVAAAGADAVVQTNNIQAGEIACQFIADKLGEKGGKVIIQNGPQVGGGDRPGQGLQGGAGQEPEDRDPVLRPGRQGLARGRPQHHAGPPHPVPADRRRVHHQRPAGGRQRPRRQAARPQRVHHHLGRRRAGHRDRAEGQHPGPGLGQPGPLQDRPDRRSRSATRS